MSGSPLHQLQTPCLLLDEMVLKANLKRLRSRLGPELTFRPHLKTSKSPEVARLLMDSPSGPATVSTLREAELFGAEGVLDIVYAVGIAPTKLDRVLQLRRSGINLSIILDSVSQAEAVADACRKSRDGIPVFVEIDCDGHRSGVSADSSELLEIGICLESGGACLKGVLTHAGASYDCASTDCIIEAAEQERTAAVLAAERLRAAGLSAPVVSVGSTPTAMFSRNFSGLTEVRAGVFAFFDLVMLGLGVCQIEDIAIFVLSSVIGHQRATNRIVVDAGWMALSRDRGTSKQWVDQGYGLVCDKAGRPFGDIIVLEANQEHGIIGVRPGSFAKLPNLEIGELIRILPNHACATSAQHDAYHVLTPSGMEVRAIWPRFSGW